MHSCNSEIARSLQGLRGSALGDVANRYATHLEKWRLAPATIARYLRAVTHFAKWARTKGIRPFPPLHNDDVQKFLRSHLRKCTCTGRVVRSVAESRAALNHLVRVLRREGCYVDSWTRPRTGVDQEVDRFDQYLTRVCGAATQTRIHRTRHVREFLIRLFGEGPVQHKRISPDSFGLFFRKRTRRCRPGTAGVIAGGLRSYVRFLVFEGHCDLSLVDAVPTVARWPLASLPAHLSSEELDRFLRAFDRRSTRGRRDYAMSICLAELGLRASEVARLKLSEIDWQTGAVIIAAGKTSRERMLPISRRLGGALISYLRRRPRTKCDRVFVRLGALEGDAIGPSVVRSAVRLAYQRAGLPSSYTGTHLLRHTAATRLVASGASLKEVADLLGHVSLDSTVLYAKVDLPRLRKVAMPWPRDSR